MREIIFRGKRKDNGKWIEGYYAPFASNKGLKHSIYTGIDKGCIIPIEVIPETVGQYTGLCDKNGNKIFEGDILGEELWDNRILGVVKYGEGTFDSGIYEYTGFFYEHPANGSHDHTNIAQSVLLEGCVVVIGNIHDNPELLEVEQ